jgi:hypothetical protein
MSNQQPPGMQRSKSATDLSHSRSTSVDTIRNPNNDAIMMAGSDMPSMPSMPAAYQQQYQQQQQQQQHAAHHQQQQQIPSGLHRRTPSQRSLSPPRSSISTTRTLALDTSASQSSYHQSTNHHHNNNYDPIPQQQQQQQHNPMPPPAYLVLRGAVIGMDMEDALRHTRKRKTFTVHIYPWDTIRALRDRIAGLLRVIPEDISLFRNNDSSLRSHADSRLDWGSHERLTPKDVLRIFPTAMFVDTPLVTVAEVFDENPGRDALNVIVSVNRDVHSFKKGADGFYNYYEDSARALSKYIYYVYFVVSHKTHKHTLTQTCTTNHLPFPLILIFCFCFWFIWLCLNRINSLFDFVFFLRIRNCQSPC